MERMIVVLLLQLSCHCFAADTDNHDGQIMTFPRQKNPTVKHDDDESANVWKLPFFPKERGELEFDPRSIFAADRSDLVEVDANCDNGTRNLKYDWDDSMPENYTCSGETIVHDVTVAPAVHGAWIPPAYTAPHYCMNVNISYYDPLITFGGHRKVWARYGEYEYVPKQRWLHNAENGAVIMLYHPCADPQQIEKLRKIVRSCLFRHIITPYHLLPQNRPLALVTWGWQLSMNVVRPMLALRFIREHALKAPKNLNLDGKYDYALKQPAKIVSDENDSRLCVSFM